MESTAWLPDELAQVLSRRRRGRTVWLVGGAVRDQLLGRTTDDFDFVVDRDAIGLARRVADDLQADYYTLDAARDIGRVLTRRFGPGAWTLDFSGLRAGDILDDLRTRDVTLNALAVPLGPAAPILDPCGGAHDLRRKRLRACSAEAITADPVRALRIVRLACDLGFQIDPATAQQVAQARDSLGHSRPAMPLRLLHHLGLLQAMCPEVVSLIGLQQPPPHVHDAFEYTLAAIDGLSQVLSVLGHAHDEEAAAELSLAGVTLHLGRFRDVLADHLDRPLVPGRSARQVLFLAALYHAAGKATVSPQDGSAEARAGAELAAEEGRRLRLSSGEIDRLRGIVLHLIQPMRLEDPQAVTRRIIHRFFRDVGEAGVEVVLLALGSHLGTQVPPPEPDAWEARLLVARRFLEAYFEEWDEVVRPAPLVRGDTLARSLGLSAGPMIGRLLERLAEAQAEGEIHTPDQALDFALKVWQQEAGELEAPADQG
jgi:hypothetical protein